MRRKQHRTKPPAPKADGTYRTFETEAELQNGIENFARRLGYDVFHDELARGDYKGYPDLTICGCGLVLYVECKGPKGSTTEHQERWIRRLRIAGQAVIVASTEDDEAGYNRVTTILMEQFQAFEGDESAAGDAEPDWN